MARVRRIRIELDPADVIRVKIAPMVTPAVFNTTRETLNRARVLTPVDTGNLRASLDMTVKPLAGFRRIVGRVSTRVKYAEMVHNGTRAHIIRATKAGALAFVWPKAGGKVLVPKRRGATYRLKNGTLIIGKGYVNHPGTRPRPYLTRALVEVAPGHDFRVEITPAQAENGPE